MSAPMIPARPTTYKGIQMRSRLEARFAASLDEDGIQWLYEPRAYASNAGQYLPDFQFLAIRGKPITRPTFVEVRPTLDRAYLAMTQMPVIWDSEPEARFYIVVPVWGEYSPWFTATGTARTWRSDRVQM